MSGELLEGGGGQIFSAMQSSKKSGLVLHLKEVENINLNVGQCFGCQVWIMGQGWSSAHFWLISGLKAEQENGFRMRNFGYQNEIYLCCLSAWCDGGCICGAISWNALNCRPDLLCQDAARGQNAGFICFPPSARHLLGTLFNCRAPWKFGVGSQASWKCSNYEMTFTGNGAALASPEPKPRRTEVISPPEGKQQRQHPVDFIDFDWHGLALLFKAVIITVKLPCGGPRVGGGRGVQSSTEPKTTLSLPNGCIRFTTLLKVGQKSLIFTQQWLHWQARG